MRPAPLRATSGSIAGSSQPALTSFTMSAPASSAASATAASVVSTEIATPECVRTRAITGTTRRTCSSASTRAAPGRVLSPPMSMMVAPSSTSCSAYCAASSALANWPPSLKLSGVTLTTPMIANGSSETTRSDPAVQKRRPCGSCAPWGSPFGSRVIRAAPGWRGWAWVRARAWARAQASARLQARHPVPAAPRATRRRRPPSP